MCDEKKEIDGFEQYMTAVYRNGLCFRDVFSEREVEIARHAWIWSRKAAECGRPPEAYNV
jgi:hypothetical protein